jgi:hypothetical protein
MAFKAQKFELVELQVPGVAVTGNLGTRFSFPDQPKLRYTALQGISVYTDGTLTTSPSGFAIPSLAVMKKSYLVLYAGDRQDLYRIPLLEMNRIQNSATDPFTRPLFEFTGQKITWEKSYVELGSAPANTTLFAYCFGVFYT